MSKISVISGDITNLPMHVDALVNAANSQLIPGGGVDGALNRKAGPNLAEDMMQFGGTPTGTAVWTKAYNLDSDFVIHTVGPIYTDGNHDEAKLLESAYNSAMQVAEKLEVKSIAFPLLSTGVYSYPLEEASDIAVKTLNKYSDQFQIYLVIFDDNVASKIRQRYDL